jgi:hypothetical protein
MLKWLINIPRKWYRRRLRKLDMDFLWPVIKKQAPTLADARRAFYLHIMSDPVWYLDYPSQDIHDFVSQLN